MHKVISFYGSFERSQCGKMPKIFSAMWKPEEKDNCLVAFSSFNNRIIGSQRTGNTTEKTTAKE